MDKKISDKKLDRNVRAHGIFRVRTTFFNTFVYL